ncbi:hypothetical protein FB567DRAFT_336021 [Paraphoma chrysanthemicola]|uniref:Uncharacterized protein n=1 Tax=Paraphoma chrysanthemicola TaxID=798071 RepID=A0A8K0R7P5_9PLEO|nr:hypothetical protein FB567DRAFT_336021 [Paraphoma chrysanthemicola]
MIFNAQYFAIMASISILANALPFDTKPRQLVPRQKNYSVINVDGGSSNTAQATTVVKATKTVEVVNPGPTVTQEVTTTVVDTVSTPSATSSSSKSSSSSSSSSVPTPTISSSASSSTSTPIQTPKPIFVTVTVPKNDGPTEYYDNGLWHTNYPVKNFGTAIAAAPSSTA